MLGKQAKTQIEIFQLTQTSTVDDLQRSIEFLQSIFMKKQFLMINLIVKKKIIQDTNNPENNGNYNNELLQNQDQATKKNDYANLKLQTKTKKVIVELNKNIHYEQIKEENESEIISEHNLSKMNDSKVGNSTLIPNQSVDNPNKEIMQISKIESNVSQSQQVHRMNTASSQEEEDSSDSGSDKEKKMDQSQISEEIQHLNKQGQELFKSKDYRGAIELFRKCQLVCQKYKNKYLNYEVNNLTQIGNCYHHLKDLNAALESLNNALEITQTNALYEEDKNQIYSIFISLGQCYNDQKSYGLVIENWEKAKVYIDQNDNNKEVQRTLGHLLNNLGMANYGIQNLEKAQKYFEQSIQIYKNIFGDNDISIGNRLNNLAEVYRNSKDFDKALQCFENSLSIKRAHYKSDNEKTIANTLNNIGMTYQNLKKYTEAINYFNQSIQIYKNLYGEQLNGDPAYTVSNSYNCIGECYKSLNQFEQASNYYQESYNIRKQAFGLENKNTIHVSTGFAQLLFKIQKYQESVNIFKEVLQSQKKIYGENSLPVGQTLNFLGTVLNALKQNDEAIQYLNQALQIFQQSKQIPQSSLDKIKSQIEQIQERIKFSFEKKDQNNNNTTNTNTNINNPNTNDNIKINETDKNNPLLNNINKNDNNNNTILNNNKQQDDQKSKSSSSSNKSDDDQTD